MPIVWNKLIYKCVDITIFCQIMEAMLDFDTSDIYNMKSRDQTDVLQHTQQ